MFESAEIGHTIDKETYAEAAPKIRAALLEAQRGLVGSATSTIVIVGGVEGAGKSETVNLLLEWLDARGIQTHALGAPSDEESERPPMWRFWRTLPPRGHMGIFFGSWYTRPIVDRAFGCLRRADFDLALERIIDFERMLHNEGTLIVKLWMHLSERDQRRRLKSLEKDRLQRWRVTAQDWRYFKRYDQFRSASEAALRRTSTAEAPWTIIEASDARYRHLTAATTLLNALRGRTTAAPPPAATTAQATAAPPPATIVPGPTLLSRLDLSQHLDEDEYEARVLKYQARLARLTRRLHDEGRSLITVFEGADAAGKGGAIRRLTAAMDARSYQVISIAAPTDEERAHPYLWRFWRHLPRRGRVTIYDRSWYGRVLVERVEGFAAPADWSRAYTEINAFEEQLTEFGIVVVKFWLAISPDEQLRRFKDRETTPYKQYKLTPEDWRNRAKWDAYTTAASDMIERTSTEPAPWTPVAANDKSWARVQVMRTVVKRLESALKE